MKRHHRAPNILVLLLFIGYLLGTYSCQSDTAVGDDLAADKEEMPEYLPLIEADLDQLGDFTSDGQNWSIEGSVISDPAQEGHISTEEGQGILVNQNGANSETDSANDNKQLFTSFEHGDIELELEFLVPRGSNSGIYFMSRYELQIRDSYQDEDLTPDDCGGIYERWNDPINRDEIEPGVPPSVNAAKAPGLWQSFKVLFRAPRFNDLGEKTENARFEYVYHNGYLIHENIGVGGPTIAAAANDEVEMAPLMIQGDHGPVAFRKVRYKKLGFNRVEMSELTYRMYEGEWDYIPNFDSLTPVKSGSVLSFDDLEDLSGKNDHFGFVFEGKIHIPATGEYLFETIIDDGGDLYINDQLLVHNLGEPGIGVERGVINLDEGTHNLKITFFEEIWLALLNLKVEGPEIPKQTLASKDQLAEWASRGSSRSLDVDANEEVQLIRGFVRHGDKKLTHILSIGDPSGIHYSYDLRHNALTSAWKGDFADVSEMWNNRGEEQLLKPLNARVDFQLGTPISRLSSMKQSWLDAGPDQHTPLGYELDEEGRPKFLYTVSNIQVSDQMVPVKNGLRRDLRISSENSETKLWFRLGSAEDISLISAGYYSIGNEFYVSLRGHEDLAVIRDIDGKKELLVPVLSNSNNENFSYELIW